MSGPSNIHRPGTVSFVSASNVQCNSRSPGPVLSVWTKPDPRFLVRDPFPSIRARHGEDSFTHKQAMSAIRELDILKTQFGKTYAMITLLRNEVVIKLDENGQRDMSFLLSGASKAKLKKVLEDKIFKSAATVWIEPGENTTKINARHINSMKRLLAKVFSVATIATIRRDFDNIDLVRRQAGSRKKEAELVKLVFCMKALIKAESNDPNYAPRLIRMMKNYEKFENQLGKLEYFYDLEQKLSGKTSETKMWPKRDFL